MVHEWEDVRWAKLPYMSKYSRESMASAGECVDTLETERDLMIVVSRIIEEAMLRIFLVTF